MAVTAITTTVVTFLSGFSLFPVSVETATAAANPKFHTHANMRAGSITEPVLRILAKKISYALKVP